MDGALQLIFNKHINYSLKKKLKRIAFLDADAVTFNVFYLFDFFHQGHLSEQGKLIMQGSFQMSTEHKGKLKDLRFKPMQRQMFLHQKSILLCKRREDTHSSDKVQYSFKNLLKVSDKYHELLGSEFRVCCRKNELNIFSFFTYIRSVLYMYQERKSERKLRVFYS